jgi:hypothetical protein
MKHAIFEPEKNIYLSTNPPPTSIHLSHRFNSPSKPAAWNILIVVAANTALPFQPLRHQRKVCYQGGNSLT